MRRASHRELDGRDLLRLGEAEAPAGPLGALQSNGRAAEDPYVAQLESALRESNRRLEALQRGGRKGVSFAAGEDAENQDPDGAAGARERELRAQLALYKKEAAQLRARLESGDGAGPIAAAAGDDGLKEDLARRAFEAAWHKRKAAKYEEVKRERDELLKEVEALRRVEKQTNDQTLQTAETLDARISGLQVAVDAAQDHNNRLCVIS